MLLHQAAQVQQLASSKNNIENNRQKGLKWPF